MEPFGAGKSSYDLIDSKKVFEHLQLKEGSTFLDLACGRGPYSIAASERVGKEGRVYAVDLWEEGIRHLREELSQRGIQNVKAILSDAGDLQEIKDDHIDVCLMATVLHDFVRAGAEDRVLKEVKRVLRPEGLMAVLEFKKMEGPPGPPLRIRLAPEETGDLVRPYGFKEERSGEVGPYHYLLLFSAVSVL